MRGIAVALSLVLLCGCGGAAQQAPYEPSLEDRHPELLYSEAEFPEEPEQLASGEKWGIPVQRPGDVGPRQGILISDETAARSGWFKAKYGQLRIYYSADTKAWQTTWKHVEGILVTAESAVVEARKRTWVEKYGLEVGLVIGFVSAGLLATGLAAALDAGLSAN